MFETVLFYIISFNLLLCSFMVVLIKNPLYSVLFLVMCFVLSASLLFLLECEFISLIFIVIYVGAIAVLFLFVVMMLNIKITDSTKDVLKYIPAGNFLGFVFLLEILYIFFDTYTVNPYTTSKMFNFYTNWYAKIDGITDIEMLGQVLYTYYIIQFLVAGLLLLLAVIGASVLTLHTKDSLLKTQETFRQVSR